MSSLDYTTLESNKRFKLNFDGGDLSSDAGLLLIKEFISKLHFDKLMNCMFHTQRPHGNGQEQGSRQGF